MSEAVLKNYVAEIGKYYEKGIATEHTYRDTLKRLLEALNTDTAATNEPKRSKCGAPDYMVERNNLTIGYIEAKDIGKPLDIIEKDEQLQRYLRALDNLILTDYLEFRWYVHGEKRMTARLATPKKNKSLSFDKDGAVKVTELLLSFLDHSTEAIKKPQDLAKRMARLTHMIRDIIVEAFKEKEESANLKDLYTAFQDTLLPGLKETDFADMFSQTIAYGLFAARYNYTKKKPFTRSDAAASIPRTNPFLRKLFGTMAGPDLDDEPFVGFVDELAQVLAFTDMEAVLVDFGKRKRQEDPIVHFYETFLAQYDPKLRELRGVYYTPDPVVSYIVRSVDYLLKAYFDCPDGLADTSTVPYTSLDEKGEQHTEEQPHVLILDPATGTSTFLYHVIAHIRESYQQMGNAGMWSSYVREHLLPRLFGFELLMAPYAMAHLKLAMQLAALDLPESIRKTWAYDFKTDERLGIYLTNTLDEAIKRSDVLFGRYISEEANEAAKVKKSDPVMVILGNPPYAYSSANTGEWIGSLVREYYQVDGKPLGEKNPKGLQDDYVKFIRFAQWRIEQTGYGILAFITNHGYLDNPTFRGMRQHLMKTFNKLYVLDLHGNSNKKERSPDGSKDENVFDIQQGVAIGIFVKLPGKIGSSQSTDVYHAHLWGMREIFEDNNQTKSLVGGKYHWLAENDLSTTTWTALKAHTPFHLFIPQDRDVLKEYEQYRQITDIFLLNNVGLYTARDSLAIQWNKEDIWRTVNDFANLDPEHARQKYDLGPDTRDWQVVLAQKDVRSSGPSRSNLMPILYRPFDVRYTYYTGKSRGFICMPRGNLMHHMLAGDNVGLITTRQTKDKWDAFVTTHIIGHKAVASYDSNTLFPLYRYPQMKGQTLFDKEVSHDVSNGPQPNLSPDFIKDLQTNLKLQFVSRGKGDLQLTSGPEDILNYTYAIFSSPTYRERYVEFLAIDFPRLPLTSNRTLFQKLCLLGERLIALHLMKAFGQLTTTFPINGNNIIEKVSYTCASGEPEKGRAWINKAQYIEGIKPEVWEFQIGGYQVCEKWLKDRKGLPFTINDFRYYQRVVAAIDETITITKQIDETIENQGGWPIE